MKQNISRLERIFRWGFGVFLITWAIAGGPWWAFLGIYPLLTGSFGFCPTYYTLKINSPS